MTRNEMKEKARVEFEGMEYIPAFTITGLIDKIYDDINSRTCENCKHYENYDCKILGDWDCMNDEPCQWAPPDNFGCVLFERKENES